MELELKDKRHWSQYYCIVKGCTNKPVRFYRKCSKHITLSEDGNA